MVSLGEDEISFKRHNKVLIKEKSKSHPNSQVVSDLMEKTFSIRRDDIVTNSCNITQLLTKYPFLSEENQVCITVAPKVVYIIITLGTKRNV